MNFRRTPKRSFRFQRSWYFGEGSLEIFFSESLKLFLKETLEDFRNGILGENPSGTSERTVEIYGMFYQWIFKKTTGEICRGNTTDIYDKI